MRFCGNCVITNQERNERTNKQTNKQYIVRNYVQDVIPFVCKICKRFVEAYSRVTNVLVENIFIAVLCTSSFQNML